jgi:DNA-binding IclR family transcriptional regulator
MVKKDNDKNANQAVTKMLHLITILSDSKLPMRLHDIAEAAGIPQATCLRYLNALIQEGYAYQDADSGRYSMTWGICRLSDRIRVHRNLRAISGDVVTRLSVDLELGICLVVEHELECMYLDCIYDSLSAGGTLVRIGKQTPLYASSSGKILLTGFSEAAIDRMISEKGFSPLTNKTIGSKDALMEEIRTVKDRGYALDDEECEAGLRCVAVPIRDYSGAIAAAVSAFGPVDVMTDEHIREKVVPRLKEAAAEISLRMGYRSV